MVTPSMKPFHALWILCMAQSKNKSRSIEELACSCLLYIILCLTCADVYSSKGDQHGRSASTIFV